MTKEEIIEALHELGRNMNKKWGVNSYPERCKNHDIIEAIKALPDPKELSRDEFAAAALTGLLADESSGELSGFASASYALADAMIEARKIKELKSQ